MIDFEVVSFVSLFVAVWLVCSALSKNKRFVSFAKKDFHIDLKDMLGMDSWGDSALGLSSNRECRKSVEAENEALKVQVGALKERVAVLEKIVTEPAYELNKKINSL